MSHLTTESAKTGSPTKEPNRKELMQLRWMLNRMSKDCQTKHWPQHKQFCKVNRRILEMPPEHAERMKQLRAFTTKHRPTLVQLGRLALDLYKHPENWLKYVLIVRVRVRHDSKKAETAFHVHDILVETPDFCGKYKDSILVQFKYMREVNDRVGGDGGYTAVIQDLDTRLQNIVGVGFTRELTDEGFNEHNWKEAMMERMNCGTVL
ncbi:hypothetical protein D9619_010010 [Psilocybe cf. subviscida]|uniref:Uncharacterized protein n=1 Tax=Psilocybe cf. subviscida TaxID=2480587 RepID=A0A8H5BKV8_9AGAR|nr:hypothetical protein D9619_010010 [Psilocybe cf. subviscida]